MILLRIASEIQIVALFSPFQIIKRILNSCIAFPSLQTRLALINKWFIKSIINSSTMKTIVNCSAIVDTQLCSSRGTQGQWGRTTLPLLGESHLNTKSLVLMKYSTAYFNQRAVPELHRSTRHEQEFTITPKMLIPSSYIITRHYNNDSATSSLLSLQPESQHIPMESNHNHNNTK